jgi:branched-chain amino acid transport system permease protein
MTTLMATAFAAVVAARLRSLPTAVVISLAMGVVTDVVQKYLPSDSTFTAAVVPSIPFAFILLFLLYYLIRGGAIGREATAGGTLDAAIRPQGGEVPATAAPAVRSPSAHGARTAGGGQIGQIGRRRPALPLPMIPLAVVAVLPALTSGYWLGLVASGLALAIVLLSFSLVIGDGGMLWLCQITFAGGGAITAAQLAAHAGFPPLLAAVAAGVVMAPIGVLLGALTIRLGDLYVALVTLSFGLLVETLIFTRSRFYQFGAGVDIGRPGFAENDRAFAYLALATFLIIGLVIVNLRRSTTGLGVSAVRWSEPAARTLGLSVVGLKVLLSGFAAFVAGLGGALMAIFARIAVPDSYTVFGGLIWIAVLVTIGSRSIVAAAVAGLSFTLLPGVIATYLPTAWGNAPGVLFGLGALSVALHPEGVITAAAEQLRQLIPRPPRPSPPGTGGGSDVGSGAAAGACAGVSTAGLTAVAGPERSER